MRLTEDDLNQPVKPQHSDKIALLLGQDWESLATTIGFETFEVDDIKEAHWYREPKDRRIALLRMWKKKYGSNATYAKIVHCLEEIKNRELTEIVIRLCKEHKLCEQNKSIKGHVDQIGVKTRKHNHHDVILSLALAFTILMYLLFTYGFMIETQRDTSTTLVETTQVNKDSTMALWSPNYQNGTNCSQQVAHDLPLLHGHFVGRENDVKEIIKGAINMNIFNINGAPGFGKSTAAIHAGYMLVEDCIPVRYINFEELSWKILESTSMNEFKDNFTTEGKSSTHNLKKQPTAVTVTAPTNSLMAKENSIHDIVDNDSKSGTARLGYMKELQLIQWSKALNHRSVLIFDNADTVLASSSRNKFIDLIGLLVQYSKLHLHIIVVSQEKLVLLENFNRWIVKQLSQQASVELLKKLAPDIADRQVKKIAELLQGCPLALKIIGSLLNIYGKEITYELEKELQQTPIKVLDKVSDQKQRFSVMLDLILSKLEFLRECGYSVGLFRGSFSRELGIKILSKDCLEMYEKQSLVDEYFLGYQHRYKMHRLIKDYFIVKTNYSEQLLFVRHFCKYFIQFLLEYTTDSEGTDIDEHTLSSETSNIDFIEDLLMSCSHHENISLDELAAIAFLVSKGFIQSENLQSSSKQYLKSLRNDHELFIHGKLIVVNHFYTRCKCKTVTEYIKKIFNHPCTNIFDCELIKELLSMPYNLTNFSQQERNFLHNVLTYSCLHNITFGPSFLYKNNNALGPAAIIILISLFVNHLSYHKLIPIILLFGYYISLIVEFTPLSAIDFYQVAIYSFDMVLIIEVGMKFICYYFNILLALFIFICWCYCKFHPFSVNTYQVKHKFLYSTCTVVLDFAIISVLLILNTVLFDRCSHLPICH